MEGLRYRLSFLKMYDPNLWNGDCNEGGGGQIPRHFHVTLAESWKRNLYEHQLLHTLFLMGLPWRSRGQRRHRGKIKYACWLRGRWACRRGLRSKSFVWIDIVTVLKVVIRNFSCRGHPLRGNERCGRTGCCHDRRDGGRRFGLSVNCIVSGCNWSYFSRA